MSKNVTLLYFVQDPLKCSHLPGKNFENPKEVLADDFSLV